MSLKNCVVVLWVYVIYGLGIGIFFSGYLLKRIVVNKNNTDIAHLAHKVSCGNFDSLRSIADILRRESSPKSDLGTGRSLKRFDKAIYIIIDALRHDFTEFDDSLSSSSYYKNKMPVFKDISRTYPERCVHRKLLADPPTTTLQRLTGLTTGSLPTFIDVGLSFASVALKEDNFVWRMKDLGKNVVFLGDDTWQGLFPLQFHRCFAFPSFNVKDLHTVDNGILDHIYDEMNKPDWDVIIAHFLGVDHCGHRYGPDHPEMATKLLQMNDMIRNVVQRINNRTLLFVLGDHGMTSTGDHGGDSRNELETTLFMYSLKKLFTGSKENEVQKQVSELQQIDLVPTLSMLLGIPIPFSNLGSAISPLFTAQSLTKERTCFGRELDGALGAALSASENAYQVQQYLHDYASMSRDFSLSTLGIANELYENASVLWEKVQGDNTSLPALHLMTESFRNYLSFVQNECRNTWAKFNLWSMLCGVIILCVAVFSSVVLAHNVTITFITIKSFVLAIITFFMAHILYIANWYIFVIFCVIVFTLLSVMVQKCLDLLSHFIKLMSLSNVVTLLLFLCHFSNSYIINEDKMVLYFLQSVLFCKFFLHVIISVTCVVPQTVDKNKKTKVLNPRLPHVIVIGLFTCLLILIRVSAVFRKCREEQINCVTVEFFKSLENFASATPTFQVFRLVVSWTSVLMPVVAVTAWIKRIHPQKNYTIGMMCFSYGVTFSAVCICLHWWLSIVPLHVLDRILGQHQMIAARCAIAMCTLALCLAYFSPVVPEKPLDFPTNHIFIGSHFLFTFTILLPIYLVVGDGIAPSITMMIAFLVSFLTLDSITSNNSESYQQINILIWYISSWHWFYSTGHQPTFLTLEWNAAFVISKEVISYTLSGIFVLMNSFSSQIIHGITLPLLVIFAKSPKDPNKPVQQLLLTYISLHGLKLLGSVLSCFLLRRHLMVWKVFTPKLIYESVSFCITALAVLIGYLFSLRVTASFHSQIKKNAGQLWFLKDE